MSIAARDPRLEEIAALLEGVKWNGKGFTASCPAHADTDPSLSVNPGDKVDVVYHCHAGCTQDEVLTAVQDLKRGATDKPVTVEALAEMKGLSVEFLESLGLNNNAGTVIVPYRLADGKRAPRHRRRLALKASGKGSAWTGPKGGLIVPYGLDRLQGEGRDFCFLVEGESD